MRLNGINLTRLGAVHAIGLAALAFSNAAHASNDPPLPSPRSVAIVIEASPGESTAVSADSADSSADGLESPAKMAPSAPATAQKDTSVQSPTGAISPTYAQESPERASVSNAPHAVVSAGSHAVQYHPRQAQYQRVPATRHTTAVVVLQARRISSREQTKRTSLPPPIGAPNEPQNEASICPDISDESWSPDMDGSGVELPAESDSAAQCEPQPPASETAVDAPSQSVACPDDGTQYQPEDEQYQAQPSETCDAPDDSVVPTDSEPIAPTTPDSSDGDAATVPVPQPAPAPEPVDAPATQGHARLVPSRFRPASSSKEEPATPAPRIAARSSAASTDGMAKPRPKQVSHAKPKSRVFRRNAEAVALQSPGQGSAQVDLFGDWLLLSLEVSLVLALGLLLLAGGTAARSVQSRLKSTGLSDRHPGANGSGGIRYRE